MPETTLACDLMTTPVVRVSMDDTLADARAVFEAHRFHHLVVSGDDGRMVGVLSDRDLLKHISPFVGKMAERPADLASLRRRVHQVMTRSLLTCREQTLGHDAALLMLRGRIGCLPVVDRDRRCVGILTIRDIAGWAIDRVSSPGRFIPDEMIRAGMVGLAGHLVSDHLASDSAAA